MLQITKYNFKLASAFVQHSVHHQYYITCEKNVAKVDLICLYLILKQSSDYFAVRFLCELSSYECAMCMEVLHAHGDDNSI